VPIPSNADASGTIGQSTVFDGVGGEFVITIATMIALAESNQRLGGLDRTGTDRIEFDTLCEKVLANMPEAWVTFAARAESLER